MGREIRRVPPDWHHPKNARGHYQPMMDITYAEAMADWDPSCDNAPSPDYYRPEWPEGSATAYQIYETVSEGTPVSPVLPDREAVIRYLTSDGTGMGIGGTVCKLSRAAAERFLDSAWAPSGVFSPSTGMISGVQALEYDGDHAMDLEDGR